MVLMVSPVTEERGIARTLSDCAFGLVASRPAADTPSSCPAPRMMELRWSFSHRQQLRFLESAKKSRLPVAMLTRYSVPRSAQYIKIAITIITASSSILLLLLLLLVIAGNCRKTLHILDRHQSHQTLKMIVITMAVVMLMTTMMVVTKVLMRKNHQASVS